MKTRFRAGGLNTVLLAGVLGVGLSLASVASAQEVAGATAEVAAAAEASGATAERETVGTADFAYTINTLVMFICAVLVLFMQAGFAMLEAGMNSAKNTINILAKNVMDLSVGVILFLLIGFALMYPGSWAIDGYLGVPSAFVERDNPASPRDDSTSADFIFQVAFAATAATIVSGAVGGFAGLAGAILLGPRLGRFTADGKSVPLPGHNITFAALGVFILWVGWYGFNPGSQLTYAGAANAEATSYIALTTTIGAAAGAGIAMLTGWGVFGKPDLTMALNGVLGGLVGVTANCDRISQVDALVIGGVAGALVVLGIVMLDKLKIDDPVGAWPVHGLCGVWGGIATGIFGDLPEGIESVGSFVGVPLLATVVICAWAFAAMFGVFAVLKTVGMLRVSPEHEQAGLDVSEHGMHAYPSDALPGGAVA